MKNQTVQGRRYNFQNNSSNSQERDIWQKGSILFPYINFVKNLIENMLELLCGNGLFDDENLLINQEWKAV